MGRLIVSEFVSLDGYYADAAGELDWVTADDEHHDYSIALLKRTGLLLFGRRTFEVFAAYWPRIGDDPDAPERERTIGAQLDRLPKTVYSRTLDSAPGWHATVRTGLEPGEVMAAKAATDGEVVVFGSGQLAGQLAGAGLVDEYHLLVQPVALGGGAPLFPPGRRTELVLRHGESLRSGVVRTFYAVAGGPVSRVNYRS